MSPLPREDLSALFSGKSNEPVVQDIDMDGPRLTEHLAPCTRRDLKCVECGATMILRPPGRYKSPFYACSAFPVCRGTHGAHPDGRPKGIPGDRATKAARIKAHRAFDRIWGQGRMTRDQAYAWMRRVLHVPVAKGEELHIGHLTVEQCEALIAAVNETYPSTRTIWERLREHARRVITPDE